MSEGTELLTEEELDLLFVHQIHLRTVLTPEEEDVLIEKLEAIMNQTLLKGYTFAELEEQTHIKQMADIILGAIKPTKTEARKAVDQVLHGIIETKQP